MKFKSYRRKLITIFILITIIPITFILLIVNYDLRRHLIESEINHIYNDIESKSESIDYTIFNKEYILNSIINDYEFMEDDLNSNENIEEINKYLEQKNIDFKSVLNIYISTEKGFDYNSRYIDVKEDGKDREWYINAKKSKDIVWTKPYKDLLTGKEIITLSMPIIDEEKVKGVVGLDIDFNEIYNRLSQIKISKVSTTYLIDSNGEKLDIIGEDIINSFKDLKFQEVLNSVDGNQTIELDKNYFIIHTTIDSNGWKILSVVERKSLIKELIYMNEYIGYIVIITIIIVIALAIMYSKQFSKPLNELKLGAIQIKNGNYEHKVYINNNDEFDDVANTFNSMASNIKAYHEGLVHRSEELEESNIELEASYEQLEATLEQLNDSEEKYRRLVENMYDLVWIVDNDYNIAFVNESVSKLLKYEKNDIVGKNIKDITTIWENTDTLEHFLINAKESDYENAESVLIDKNGNRIIVEISTKRIFENGRLVGVQGLMRDITESKNMEVKILKKNNELITINKISKELNSSLDLDWLLSKVSNDLCKLLDISLCTIRTINDDNKLKVRATSGKLTNSFEEKEFSIAYEKMIDIISDNNCINLSKIPAGCYENFSGKTIKVLENKFISVIPISSKHSLSGMISIFSEEKLGKDDINIINSIANQTAMVIDNIDLYKNLKKSYLRIIEGLVAALDAKDSYTEGHSLRVSKYSLLIAQKLNLPHEKSEDIKISGILHDIGKIGISDYILSKPGKLTEDEYKIITKHPMIGSRILEKVGVSQSILNGVRYHHKNYNLKGYPKDIVLKKLPIEASIIGVADAFDAMTSNRSYRNSLGFDAALSELLKYKGSQFEPKIVDAFLDLWTNEREKVLEIAHTKRA